MKLIPLICVICDFLGPKAIDRENYIEISSQHFELCHAAHKHIHRQTDWENCITSSFVGVKNVTEQWPVMEDVYVQRNCNL